MTTVFAASDTLYFAVFRAATTSLLGSIFGKGYYIFVPGSIGRPLSLLAKNDPSIIVVIMISFYSPIEIY